MELKIGDTVKIGNVTNLCGVVTAIHGDEVEYIGHGGRADMNGKRRVTLAHHCHKITEGGAK